MLPLMLSIVGKTSCQLKQGISEYKNTIKRKDVNYPVNVSSLCFCGIEKVNVPLSVVDIEMLLQRCELF